MGRRLPASAATQRWRYVTVSIGFADEAPGPAGRATRGPTGRLRSAAPPRAPSSGAPRRRLGARRSARDPRIPPGPGRASRPRHRSRIRKGSREGRESSSRVHAQRTALAEARSMWTRRERRRHRGGSGSQQPLSSAGSRTLARPSGPKKTGSASAHGGVEDISAELAAAAASGVIYAMLPWLCQDRQAGPDLSGVCW